MNLLAFDTATSACSAACRIDGRDAAHESVPMVRGQSEALMPMIQRVLADSGLVFADLDGIAVTVGPGAFTGIRIGLAAARGIALAAALPTIGVTTLEAVAAGAAPGPPADRPILAIIDAKRADVYAQAFGYDLEPLTKSQSLLPDELPALVEQVLEMIGSAAEVLLAGDGVARVLETFEAAGLRLPIADTPGWPDPRIVASIAARRADNGGDGRPQPLYLRPPQATRPRHGGRLRP